MSGLVSVEQPPAPKCCREVFGAAGVVAVQPGPPSTENVGLAVIDEQRGGRFHTEAGQATAIGLGIRFADAEFGRDIGVIAYAHSDLGIQCREMTSDQ